MCCRAGQALLVVGVVIVACVGPSVATPPHTYVHNQQETLQDIAINQMADPCLRVIKEEVIPGLQAMERQMQAIEGQMQTMEGQMQTMEGQMQTMEGQMQTMEGQVQTMEGQMQTMEGQITAMQQIIRNSSESQQKNRQRPFLDINHNDTNPSLGSTYKVLYGSRGSLSPSYPQFYQNSVRYEWRVILPDGTRPVFTWEFIDMENSCSYDSVTIKGSDDIELPKICGTGIPRDSHPMYHNITGNEFSVVFSADGSNTGRGFILHYTAEVAP